MRRTGPTKKSTRLLIRALKKASIERKQRVWKTIAQLLEKPRRQRAYVNLQKIRRLNKRFKGKTLVVPGKVLGTGILEEKVSVSALEWSESAYKKITANQGNLASIKSVLEQKEKPAHIMIIK
ncbi:50S ribosomal protein L18e [Candidatus Micrarchaeota archaeon]|nr:50S ribosomal protein L18e [Candidatus Micrarchaeota archaeon]MBU1930922.1 50S ribosomal protein L18e [Candidatus Micrarchaeota archaeon]